MMDDADRKAFPTGFRRLTDVETAAAAKCHGLDRELADIDRSVAALTARRADLEILRDAHGMKLPVGEVIEIAKPEVNPKTGELEGPDNSGFWVKE